MRRHSRKTLSEIVSMQKLGTVYNSYHIVGDIAIIRLPKASKKRGQNVAKAVMSVHKNVRTVLAQTGAVRGNLRLRKLEYLAGENETVTLHRESGCLFSVDVEKCYFSPRLSHERMRVARQVGEGEVVVNMFAGVGCFSILIAKYSGAEKVYSIDVNPVVFQYMQKNIRMNRVFGKVIPVLGDAREIVEKRLCHSADRVLMPLPEKAFEYLPYALLALKKRGGWIHYYDFEHARKDENAAEKVRMRVSEKLQHLGMTLDISSSRVVRATGPNWYQAVLDIATVPGQSTRGKS